MKVQQLKGITVGKWGLQGDGNTKIFINDDLTSQKRLLFKKAREIKVQKNYKAAYISNGRIFIRKNDSDPPIIILMKSDLNL